MFRTILSLLLVTAVLLPALAQPPGRTADTAPAAAPRTEIHVELLTTAGSPPLAAQTWGQAFDRLGVSLQVRRGIPGEKADVRESMTGRTRRVTAVGILDRSGDVAFPAATFAPSEQVKLSKWLDELRTFGAQGAPDGQPAWGLSQEQSTKLLSALSEPVAAGLHDLSLADAMSRMELPDAWPWRMTASAEDRIRKAAAPTGQGKIRNHLSGLSKGTTLALVLNEFGLGFRPARTPDGSIEFVIDSLDTIGRPWPLGWPVPDADRAKVAPSLFRIVPVELDDVAFLDVTNVVAEQTGIPIAFDYNRLDQRQIDPATLRITYPPRRVVWSRLLRGIASSGRMVQELASDERGHPFVLFTPNEPGRTRRDD